MAAPAYGQTIIEIRTHLFQLGNSLEAAPFRDKRRILLGFAR